MKEIDQITIKDMLRKDHIGRNQQLEAIMNFINHINYKLSPVLAIDSPWGSGKTVFTKQLELINTNDDIQATSIDEQIIEIFREKNSVYYFNAWENDYIDDPLNALVLNLIKDLDTQGMQAKAMQKALKGFNLSAFIKNVTKDGIDIAAALEPDLSIKIVSELLDRKNRVHELLNAYITDTGKRLVFIIDELDRCKPSFAVNLLESIKHYFSDDNIVFIVAVDTSQLVHTICKYYGERFDGATYLNRFFDYNISLQTPNKKKYLANYIGVKDDSLWIRLIPKEIVTYLDMSLREIETYFSAIELLSGYISNPQGWRDEKMTVFAQYIFVPLALALKIKKRSELSAFIKGNNKEILKNLILQSNAIQTIIKRYAKETQDFTPEKAVELTLELYNDLFFKEDDYDLKNTRNETLEAVNLISQYSTIKQLSMENKND